MTTKNLKPITVQTTVNANIEKVWDYWTMQEHITNWNFASDEWCCPRALNDVKPGGKFSWRMEAKDGSMGFDFEGEYIDIVEKKLITYRIADGRSVIVKFTENGNQVTVSETFEAEGINSDELQRAGWQAILDNFKNYVETN